MKKIDEASKSPFPTSLIILGVVILILAFVGSFGYSFFKNKIASPAGTFGEQKPDQDLVECKPGAIHVSTQGNLSITGRENIAVEGTSYPTCCMESVDTSTAEAKSSKVCALINQSENFIIFDKINNKFVMTTAFITRNGQECTFAYDENGQKEAESCVNAE